MTLLSAEEVAKQLGVSAKTVEPLKTAEPIEFSDLIGRHCFRVDCFPYAFMFEAEPMEMAWKQVDNFFKSARETARDAVGETSQADSREANDC